MSCFWHTGLLHLIHRLLDDCYSQITNNFIVILNYCKRQKICFTPHANIPIVWLGYYSNIQFDSDAVNT
jgi:hypothetical protein